MNPLAGQLALITGSGQGVGQGIALALAERGVNIAVVGRTLEKCENTCTMLDDLGVTSRAYEFDVTDTAAIPVFVDRVAADFGRLDIMVNNAYVGAYGPLAQMTDEEFQRGFNTGPFAAFAFMKAAHPHALSPGLQGWISRNPEEAEEFVASIPLRRIGDPVADIGRAVAALVSPDMQYLSGATIPLDGGQAHFG